MERAEIIALTIYGGFWVLMLIGVIALGIRAYRIKQTEDFEDRDN